MADLRVDQLTELVSSSSTDWFLVTTNPGNLSRKQSREELFTDVAINGGTLIGVDIGGGSTADFSSLTTALLLLDDGSETTPSSSFTLYPTTGTFAPATNAWAVTTDGQERLRIDSSGRVLIGAESGIAGLNSVTAQLQIASVGGGNAQIIRYDSTANPVRLQLLKSRGSTISTHGLIQQNDVYGIIQFGGSDGIAFRESASIQVIADSTPGTTDMPGAMVFSTTPDGAPNTVERIRISNGGNVVIGSLGATGDTLLHVWASSAGSVTATAGTQITVESSSDSGIQILSGAANTGDVYFGDAGSASIGRIRYDHSTNKMDFFASGFHAARMESSASAVNVPVLSGAATGNGITIGAYSGTDTDVSISIEPQGAGTITAGARLITAASTTSAAGLNVPHGAAPSSPSDGDVWTTTSGLYARIASSTVGPFTSNLGTVTSVNITQPASGITVSGGPVTSSGSITLSLADDLAAIEALGPGGGVAVRTGASAWTLRTITGTANEISVGDGSGVSGNPTLSLPSALTFTGKTVTGGTYNSVSLGTPSITGAGFLTNTSAPASPVGGIYIYSESGVLKWKDPAGTVYSLASTGAAIGGGSASITDTITATTANAGKVNLCSAASVSYAVTLPAASSAVNTGAYTFFRTDANQYVITIQRAGSDTIRSVDDWEVTSMTLNGRGTSLTFVSDGTYWYNIAQVITSNTTDVALKATGM